MLRTATTPTLDSAGEHGGQRRDAAGTEAAGGEAAIQDWFHESFVLRDGKSHMAPRRCAG